VEIELDTLLDRFPSCGLLVSMKIGGIFGTWAHTYQSGWMKGFAELWHNSGGDSLEMCDYF
jgi:hypothetical protein